MKRLSQLILILSLGFLILLAGCGNTETLPSIEGFITVVPYKTSLTVKTTFVDTEGHDLYYSNVRTYIILNSVGDEAKELSRKDVTVSKPAIDDTSGEAVIERNLSGANVDFSSLTANTTYVLKLVISSNGIQKTLATKEVTTINNGESEDDPILVYDLEGLLACNKEKTAYYKLMNDIDCEGQKLAEIFTSSTIFTGQFDGDNHTISNFVLTGNNYTGLFGYMKGATVKNLKLDTISYDYSRSNTYLGALTGYAERCTITNVHAINVTISHGGQTSSNGYIGGLIGEAKSSTVENCSVENLKLTITKAQLQMYAGGFIGSNSNSTIKDCYIIGETNVTIAYPSNPDGCLYLGGFVGINDSNLGIQSCYSNNSIKVIEPETVGQSGYRTHSAYIGGFVGGNIHNTCRISDSVAIGDISVTIKYSFNVYIGGFVGALNDYNSSRLLNCFYIPLENGLTLEFAAAKDESTDTEAKETENKDEEQSQVVYVSMTVGKADYSISNIQNVYAYKEIYDITNPHKKVNVTEYQISDDLMILSGPIQEAIKNILNQE